MVIDDLYGKQPGVAVRELLQNAVDAVRERWRLNLERDAAERHVTDSDEVDVIVSVEERPDGYVLCVSDRGVGMTADTVARFFLTAGASFGPSMAERESLSVDDSVRTTKAGRFGVGAFAPFLLGPRYEVTSRHVQEPHGLTFVADISEDLVELTKTTEGRVGTEVVVPISAERLDTHPFMLAETAAVFYGLDRPRVQFETIDARGNVTPVRQSRRVPSPDVALPANWRQFSPPNFDVVYWTPRSRGQSVVHNGFVVRNPSKSPPLMEWTSAPASRVVAVPEMAIFDPKHSLRLTLHRYDFVTAHLPFEDELLRDIGLDVLAFTRVRGSSVHYPLGRSGALDPVDSDSGWFPATPGAISRYVSGRLLVASGPLSAAVKERLRKSLGFEAVAVVPLDSAKSLFGSWISSLISTPPTVLRVSLTAYGREQEERRRHALILEALGDRAPVLPPGPDPDADDVIPGYEWITVKEERKWRCATSVPTGARPTADVDALLAAVSVIVDGHPPRNPRERMFLWSLPVVNALPLERLMEPWDELIGEPLPHGDQTIPELERRLAGPSAMPGDWRDRQWGPAGDHFYD